MRAQEAADRLVESGQETGLQVAAYLRGELVVDVCAGLADAASGRPVDGQTLFHSFSAGKGAASTVVHVLAERGLVDYGAPVAEYWPEFGGRGKHKVTVAQVLTHSAGVPQTPVGTTAAGLADWELMCERIAMLDPLWEPGTASEYHAVTFGYILGEVVRRVTRRPMSQVLAEQVTAPLGIADSLFFAVPDEAFPRLARLEDSDWTRMLAAQPDSSTFFRTLPRSLLPSAGLGNRPGHLTADNPSAGTMTAQAFARMYAALIGEVDGVRLISPERTTKITAVAAEGFDHTLGRPMSKGLGYFLGMPEMGHRREAFGVKGSGGSIAFADPAHGFAFALTKNRLTGQTPDIADQIRKSLDISV
ncbi:serine hydrolase domain-containing protein [Actinomadura fulvescens]|uniref:serine hydrolase domain-containing protein n=1 Tax=Actinomadura fulvescens TaxID=46160 RepID=UPI0031DF8114